MQKDFSSEPRIFVGDGFEKVQYWTFSAIQP